MQRLNRTTESEALTEVWNLPNRLTVARLVLSVIVFLALHYGAYGLGTILFVVTVATDWLDGFLARRWNQITQFGRIMDPLADKIVICGTFVFLAAADNSEIAPWMAVVVLAREFIVTVMRSFLEQHGHDFSATWSGKWKMVVQCAAALASLVLLYQYANGIPVAETWTLVARVLVWSAIGLTLYSGYIYLQAGWSLLVTHKAENPSP